MDVLEIGATLHRDMAAKDDPEMDIHPSAPKDCRERYPQDILKGSGQVEKLFFGPSRE